MIQRLWRQAWRTFRGPARVIDGQGLFRDHTAMAERSWWLVRAFYAYLAYLAIEFVPDWSSLYDRHAVIPLWPLAWLEVVPHRTGLQAVLWFFLLSSLAGTLCTRQRWARAAAFLGVFLYWAAMNSFGKIGHSLHVLVLIAGVWVWLPDGRGPLGVARRRRGQQLLLWFWVGQGVLALSYAMAGAIKIVAGCYQWAAGQPHLFLPDALARHVAYRLEQTGAQSWLSTLVMEWSSWTWLFMWGAIYLELAALWALFRPRLQVVVGAGLIIFHVCSFWTMTILFSENCFLLALLFCSMPLLRGSWRWRYVPPEMPGFGFLSGIYRTLFKNKCS